MRSMWSFCFGGGRGGGMEEGRLGAMVLYKRIGKGGGGGGRG